MCILAVGSNSIPWSYGDVYIASKTVACQIDDIDEPLTAIV